MLFSANFLTLNDGSVISLLSVERVKFLEIDDSEIELLNHLKDDSMLEITMLSGEKHVVSMKEFAKQRNPNLKSKKEYDLLRISIVDRWKHLLSRN